MHRAGMALSAWCLLHCLAAPILIAALPLSLMSWLPAGLIDTEWLHAALIAPVVIISGPVLLRGGQMRIAVVTLGFSALIAALFVTSKRLEITLTVGGALILLIAHWLTLQQQRRARLGISGHV